MKKVLLGTSAIALAGAFASQASAAEWTVRVGGYMEQYAAYSETDTDLPGDFDGFENKSDQEILFRPSITLDNGLTFTGELQLEGMQNGDQMDEVFLNIEGSFGTVTLGERDVAPFEMAYTAPDVTFLNINSGSDTKFWGGALLTTFTSTLPQVAYDPQGISYYSPRFAGFQVGATYARDDEGNDGQSQLDIDSPNDTLYDIWGVGANYVNSFGDFNVALSGGYTAGQDHDGNDATSWAAGLNLGYGGFTVGGSYKQYRADSDLDVATAAETFGLDSVAVDATTVLENDVWDVGVSYETGPWGFSFTYIRLRDHGSSNTFFDSDGVELGTGDLDLDVDKFLLGVNYALAKGVNLGAFGVYADAEGSVSDGEGSASLDEDGWILGTGVKINF